MQTSNRIFDDLAKVAGGAASTLAGVKDEIEALARQQIERFLADGNLVTRDEFEAMAEVARNARAAQEDLEARVAELEKQLARKSPAKGAKAASRAKKPASRKGTAKATGTTGQG